MRIAKPPSTMTWNATDNVSSVAQRRRARMTGSPGSVAQTRPWCGPVLQMVTVGTIDSPGAPRSTRRMDFNLSEDQRAIEDAARAFALAELAPHSARWDEDKVMPREVLQAAAALGFAGLYVQEDVGGSALGRLDASIVFE